MQKMKQKIIEKYMEKTAKDCYKLVKTSDAITLKGSKLGGVPYIPVGKDIPKDSDGEYMALLLQINLKDIQLPNYPQTGFIEIFISSYLDWPQESKILYFVDNEQARTDLPPTINTVVEEPIAIRFEKCIEYMPIEDYRSNDIIKIVLQECKISEENLDEIIDLLWDEVPREHSTMCGYANFTQYDPRNSESDQDACFFKLDSLFDKKIDIGDAGILSVFCSEADIANQQYKKMICYWDCC